MSPLPVLAEMILGGSAEITFTARNAQGVAQADPVTSVLAQKGDEPYFEVPYADGAAIFEPEETGTYTISVRVTAPVRAIREGLVKVVPSAIKETA